MKRKSDPCPVMYQPDKDELLRIVEELEQRIEGEDSDIPASTSVRLIDEAMRAIEDICSRYEYPEIHSVLRSNLLCGLDRIRQDFAGRKQVAGVRRIDHCLQAGIDNQFSFRFYDDSPPRV